MRKISWEQHGVCRGGGDVGSTEHFVGSLTPPSPFQAPGGFFALPCPSPVPSPHLWGSPGHGGMCVGGIVVVQEGSSTRGRCMGGICSGVSVPIHDLVLRTSSGSDCGAPRREAACPEFTQLARVELRSQMPVLQTRDPSSTPCSLILLADCV